MHTQNTEPLATSGVLMGPTKSKVCVREKVEPSPNPVTEWTIHMPWNKDALACARAAICIAGLLKLG